MLTKDVAFTQAKSLLATYDLIEFLGKDSIECVFAAGSVFEGFGNEQSDIDLFFVLNKDRESFIRDFVKKNPDFAFYKRRSKIILIIRYQEMDFDIEFHTVSQVLTDIEDVNNNAIGSRDFNFDFWHRIQYAQGLYNSENIDNLKGFLNYDMFKLIKPKYNQTYFYVNIVDVMGAYESQDFQTSYLIVRELLEETIVGYLSLYGETNPSKKWLIKKIQRYSTNYEHSINLLDMLSKAYNGVELYDEKVLKFKTEQILKYCQHLNYLCEKLLKGGY
ncbi:TPA: hypothetical protein ACHS06_000214 [Streptococcus agalactiae]